MVPTTYIDSHNKTIQSNQYSVTEHFKPTVDTHHGGQLPGVFIFYDLSPIKVPILVSIDPTELLRAVCSGLSMSGQFL